MALALRYQAFIYVLTSHLYLSLDEQFLADATYQTHASWHCGDRRGSSRRHLHTPYARYTQGRFACVCREYRLPCLQKREPSADKYKLYDGHTLTARPWGSTSIASQPALAARA